MQLKVILINVFHYYKMLINIKEQKIKSKNYICKRIIFLILI